jgi:hypothetical protein
MFKKKNNPVNITLKRAECTICGKVAITIQEVLDHYKEHPEITVINGPNEADVLEHLEKNEKQENVIGKKGISVVIFNEDGTVFSNDSITEVAKEMNEQRERDGLEPLTEEQELEELKEWTSVNLQTVYNNAKKRKEFNDLVGG